MKKLFLISLLLSNVAWGQIVGTQPSPTATYTQSQELLNPTVNSWVGTVAGQNGGFSGGNTPAFNAGTNTIIFGYITASATQTIAINQALAAAGTGLKIGGYSYAWSIENDPLSGQYGTLMGTVSLKDSAGSTLQSYNYNYNTYTTGFENKSGTQWFPQDYSLSTVSDLVVSFSGKDARFWAGYYGPRVRSPSIKLEYTVDLCASNPLSDPSCPGYQAAYTTQQCSINPLFDPSCPGYQTAQCSINPLFSPACPGYQAAYTTQQCSINPLYDKSCSGYQSAYLNQQCSLNPLYDSSCPGYAAASLSQQCQADGLSSTQCPNYAEEYAKKNILGISTSSSTTTTSSSTSSPNTVSKTEASTTVSSDGKVETKVSKTGDSAVDSVIESKTTSASPSDTTASVKLTPSTGGQNVVTQTNTQTQPAKTETKTTTSNNNQQATGTLRAERSESKSSSNEGKSNSEIKQAAQEKAREEIKKAERATTFETQVAVQVNVISSMNFVPGFSAYAQSNIPDILDRQLKKQYGKDVIDNRQAGRRLFGASDARHQEMVDGQYK